MIHLIQLFVTTVSRLRDLPLFFLRLVLAYGFYDPAIKKWANIEAVAQWFANDLHIPFPLLNAYMAATTEIVGVVCMALGLATRIMSIPMMFVMMVAIATVHYTNGFSCGSNGFEVPFYYLLMLFTLLILGPGRLSIDAIIAAKYNS